MNIWPKNSILNRLDLKLIHWSDIKIDDDFQVYLFIDFCGCNDTTFTLGFNSCISWLYYHFIEPNANSDNFAWSNFYHLYFRFLLTKYCKGYLMLTMKSTITLYPYNNNKWMTHHGASWCIMVHHGASWCIMVHQSHFANLISLKKKGWISDLYTFHSFSLLLLCVFLSFC